MFPLIFGLNEASAADPHPLFASDDVLEVTVEGPFGTIMEQRNEDNQLDGTLTYENASGEPVALDVKLRVRGRFRAKHEVCDSRRCGSILRRNKSMTPFLMGRTN